MLYLKTLCCNNCARLVVAASVCSLQFERNILAASCILIVRYSVWLHKYFYLAVPPKITKTLDDEEGVEGHEFMITCKASGKPSPKYQFYRVGWVIPC